ncbi:acyl-CoA dehydrogenase [Actinomadura sp. KC345]|nr:acyl-CoA dehydrogenase [Actinomadura sp. KC345]
MLSASGALPPEYEELRGRVRGFLADQVARGRFTPAPDSWMSGIDPDFSRLLAGQGWLGMTIPVEYGGHGRTSLERYVVTEELLASGAPVAAHWIADRQMAPGILRNGTEEQKHRYLPGITRGEKLFCIGMSEADAGSDLAAVRTRAVPVAEGWRITGSKLWTSNAHVATTVVLLARSDEGERHQGLSQFVVDLPHPDVHIRPITTIDGGRHFNEVVFDDAVVGPDALLGERGAGWRQVTQELANERSGPERILSTLPLLLLWAAEVTEDDHEAKAELGRLVTRLTSLRMLSLGVAHELSAGRNPALEAALVKDLGTAFESDVTETIRRLGNRPAPDGDPLGVMLAQAQWHSPAFTLRGGSSEVLRSIVAKGLVGR